MTFAQRMRLIWIDDRLAELGRINRADLRGAFGISVQQASADFAAYARLNTARMHYDPSAKAWCCNPGVRPAFPATARFMVRKTVALVAEL